MSNESLGNCARLIKHGCLDVWEHSGLMVRRLGSWASRKALAFPRLACWTLVAMMVVTCSSKAIDVWVWPTLSSWTGTKTMPFVWAKIERCDGLSDYLHKAKDAGLVHAVPKWDCREEVDGSYIVTQEYAVNLSIGQAFDSWAGEKLAWTAAKPDGGTRSVMELTGLMDLTRASRGVDSTAMQWSKWASDPSVGASDALFHLAFNGMNVVSFIGMCLFVLILSALVLFLPTLGLAKSVKRGVNAWSASGFEERALKRELETEAKRALKSGPKRRL